MLRKRFGIRASAYCTFCALTLLCIGLSANASTVEKVIGLAAMGDEDPRHTYAYRLLVAALEESTAQYGPYQLIEPASVLNSQRLMAELSVGTNLSVGVSAYKPSWDGQTIIVPVPIERGLASYRLFFANSAKRETIDNIANLGELRSRRFGVGHGWSTAKILTDHHFTVVYGINYDGLFKMLLADRFDLFMRGAYEISVEKPILSKRSKQTYTVSNVAIFTYLPTYFHVSKKQPLLARRLEDGLKSLYSTGEIDQLMSEYYTEAIELIQQPGLVYYCLENTNLKAGMYERDKPFMLDMDINIVREKDDQCTRPIP